MKKRLTNTAALTAAAILLAGCASDAGIETTEDATTAPLTLQTAANPADAARAAEAAASLHVPAVTAGDIYLPTETGGCTVVWKSGRPDVLSDNGRLLSAERTEIELTAGIYCGSAADTVTFRTVAAKENDFFIDRAFSRGIHDGTEMSSSGLMLTGDNTSGTYISEEIPAEALRSLCGSFSGSTGPDATVELTVSLKVNGRYTKYFSYGEWGLGLRNGCRADSDSGAVMDMDEISVSGNGRCTGCRVKLILRRKDVQTPSPSVRLYALAFENSADKKGDTDILPLPREVKYDVPLIYQKTVPDIGGVICSPTTCTMLLTCLGLDASVKAENARLPAYQGYAKDILRCPAGNFAALSCDYGNGIYGNWSYNTICMGAFGADAYVRRMTSEGQLIETLALTGPVGVSVRGTVVHTGRTWTTDGHIMAVTGYRLNGDGSAVFFVNDPYYSGGPVEMTGEDFGRVCRNVFYVVE